MDWGTAVLALIGGSAVASIIAFLANRYNVSADTYLKLSATVSSLSDDLASERKSRHQDRSLFADELKRIEKEYLQKISLLEKRLSDLARERNELLLENHKLNSIIDSINPH